jgi:hypothetical protein
MNDDMHDDGLVHAHGWATEPPPSIGMLLRPVQDDRQAKAQVTNPRDDAEHDEGLVHGHAWAVGGARAAG